MPIERIRRVNNVVDVKSSYKQTTYINYLKLCISCYEMSFGLDASEGLTDKEKLFLVSCAINFKNKNRKVFSEEAMQTYKEVAGLDEKRTIANYFSRPKIKKWIYKDVTHYVFIPFLESIIKGNDTTNFQITIKYEPKD